MLLMRSTIEVNIRNALMLQGKQLVLVSNVYIKHEASNRQKLFLVESRNRELEAYLKRCVKIHGEFLQYSCSRVLYDNGDMKTTFGWESPGKAKYRISPGIASHIRDFGLA